MTGGDTDDDNKLEAERPFYLQTVPKELLDWEEIGEAAKKITPDEARRAYKAMLSASSFLNDAPFDSRYWVRGFEYKTSRARFSINFGPIEFKLDLNFGSNDVAKNPSKIAWKLLEIVCPQDQFEFVAGDLDETFRDLRARRGSTVAQLWFFTQVLGSIVGFAWRAARRGMSRALG